MKSEMNSKREKFYQAMNQLGGEILRVFPSGAMAYSVIFIVTFMTFLYANPEIKPVVDTLIKPYRVGILTAFNVGIMISMCYISIIWISRMIAGDQFQGSYNYQEHEGGVNKHVAIGMTISDASLKPLSEERIKRVSCHEAGHLFGLKFFGDEPRSLKVEVRKYQAPYLGTLSYDFDEDFLCSKDAVESAMKMSLAGAIAEEIIFGDCLIGQQTDIEKWERYARNWLASFSHSYPWFVCPSSESEAIVNAKTLKSIKDSHSKHVSELLSNNADLLIETTDIISEGMVLEGDVLLELLRKVKTD